MIQKMISISYLNPVCRKCVPKTMIHIHNGLEKKNTQKQNEFISAVFRVYMYLCVIFFLSPVVIRVRFIITHTSKNQMKSFLTDKTTVQRLLEQWHNATNGRYGEVTGVSYALVVNPTAPVMSNDAELIK